jgi:hypothetical protein
MRYFMEVAQAGRAAPRLSHEHRARASKKPGQARLFH